MIAVSMTAAELTVLGLVVEQPRHGYDLEQVIEQRGIRNWADVGFSSIYYLLTKLAKRGLIAADDDRAGPTSRRVFHATADGRAAAAAQAVDYLSEARPVPYPVLVGLANLPLLSDGDYADALRRRLIGLDARIAAVRAAAHTQHPLPRAAEEVFSYSLHLLDAERSWLAERVGGSDV